MTIKLLKIRCGVITKIALHCLWYSRFCRWMHCCQRPSQGVSFLLQLGTRVPGKWKFHHDSKSASRTCSRGFVNQLRMCWFVKFILVGFFCSLFVCLYCCLIACLRILLCKQALLLEDVIFRKDPLKMLILLSPGPPLSWKKIVSFGSHSTSYCDFGFGSKYSLEMSLIGQKDKELRNLSIGGECGKAQNCKKHNLHWFSLSPNELIIIQRALHIWSLWVCVISTLIRRMDCSFLLSQVIISGTGSCFHSCPKDPRKLDH